MTLMQTRQADEAIVSDAVQHALDEAKRQGATAADAGASLDSGLSVNVRMGEVETLEYHRGQGMAVTVYFGQRKGSASTSDLGGNAIVEAVAAACRIARFTSEDEFAGLADAELMAREQPDLDLYHPWALDAEQAIEIARACEAAGLALDPRITNSDGASVSAFDGVSAYANTHGFLGVRAGSRHGLSCALIAEDDQGMQRDYHYTNSRLPTELEAPERIGREAARRTVARLSGRKLGTRKAPILFTPELARGLIGQFISAISGGALYRRATFLHGAIGEQLFPAFVHLREDPLIPRGLGSAAYDSEGVATRPRDIVSDGILRGYVLSSYSARKLGMQTTANAGGVHNLRIEPGAQGYDELLRAMGTGLLVTELIGHGLNLVTGDYSRGAAGFWVENGEVQYPVEEITIAGNLRDVFKGIVAVGNDLDTRGNIISGSLLINEMMIAGD
ncbi:MAG: metalloprotease PmbA [Thiotrichales bacterium]